MLATELARQPLPGRQTRDGFSSASCWSSWASTPTAFEADLSQSARPPVIHTPGSATHWAIRWDDTPCSGDPGHSARGDGRINAHSDAVCPPTVLLVQEEIDPANADEPR